MTQKTIYLASFMAVISAICHWACLSCFSSSRWPCVASSAWLLFFCCSSRTSSSSLARSWACEGGESVKDESLKVEKMRVCEPVREDKVWLGEPVWVEKVEGGGGGGGGWACTYRKRGQRKCVGWACKGAESVWGEPVRVEKVCGVSL